MVQWQILSHTYSFMVPVVAEISVASVASAVEVTYVCVYMVQKIPTVVIVVQHAVTILLSWAQMEFQVQLHGCASTST